MNKQIVSKVIVPFVVCFLIALALYPSTIVNPEQYSTEGLDLDFNVPKNIAMVDKKPQVKNEKVFTPYLGKSFEAFKEALAFKESQGDYFSVNTFGYLGKYQFGKETLKMLGIYNPVYFLNTPELQEKAFIANARRNKWILRRDIKRFVGKKIGAVEVTESGILAAAHLAGAGSVKKYLRSYGANNFADGYGTTVRYYLKRFAGYDTSFIAPERKAKASI
ncbi:MAG: peptidoglycan-binding protein LysM [Winogradskyella sp.]|uniref:peptidoglycan-binding protein LysM n=1 Tax=Winogradskyella sp. TaxID=1883156 RepID=UPI0017C351BD|nr:peptidoglycan-binding protein LysM [Winogradskyella sp.]MBT8245820.1 peptidoglycan-binding protein LysM [Winogradskyella sp.]NNK22591.1 peptidoglycan-binding protein LysM [Winogradskyella sp.]